MSEPQATSSSAGRVAERPMTSKPRGICKYYTTDRGCYNGDRCKFLHGEAERLTPFDKSKVCRFYAAGFCKRGEKCWFLHEDTTRAATKGKSPSLSLDQEEERLCSICYDKPVTFGLLEGCSHIFCLSCIKNWREAQGKSEDIVLAGTTKTCPMCRTASRFVTPSAFFYPNEHPMKAKVIEKYKASMARIKCRYFEKSKPDNRFCPFGKECFYKHENADGTPYVFKHGAAHYMKQGRSRRIRDDFSINLWGDIMGGFDDDDMLHTFSSVFGSRRTQRMWRTIWNDITADMAQNNAAPLYTVEEGSQSEDEGEDEDEEAIVILPSPPESHPDAPFADPWDPSNPWADVTPEEVVVIAPESLEDNHSETASILGEDVVPGQLSVSARGLDPTTPEFVPSFRPNSAPRQASYPSFHLDWLRPLPPGPAVSTEREHGSLAESEVLPRRRRTYPDDVRERFAAHGLIPEDTTSSLDLRLLLRTPPPQESPTLPSFSTTSAASSSNAHLPATSDLPEDSSSAAHPLQSEPALVLDTDPPFMTDGRGRVVASSTTLAREREGRRGRAASSSASVLPHIKSSPAGLVSEDSCGSASHHGSPAQRPSSLPRPRLVRQRSLPSVGAGGSTVETRPAEFVTDGRGRVVFAANNRH